ncbi:hypothetical protein DIE15_07520 [Burkholderia sp. Bp9031]|nr:hypothetical protein DIE15_07520 [Burkholderia sp. Bp9031]
MSWIAAAPNMGRIVGRKPSAIEGVLPGGPERAMVGIGCLPPGKASRAFQQLPKASFKSLISNRFMGGDVLAASARFPHNFCPMYGQEDG